MSDDFNKDTSIEDEIAKSLQQMVEEETTVAKAFVGSQNNSVNTSQKVNDIEYGKTQVVPIITKELLRNQLEADDLTDDDLIDDDDFDEADEETTDSDNKENKINKTNNSTPEKNKMPKKTKIIIGASIGAVVIIAIIIAILLLQSGHEAL